MSGTAASARITVSKPFRGTSRPTESTRRSGPRSATGPSGLNCSTSTPQGSTVTRCRAAPSRTSSCDSSVEVAMTADTSRASARSIRIRTGGLVSCRPWKRFFVTPSAWKVCTTGGSARPSCRAAATAASPDIQKCACTTSGGSAARRSASARPRSPTYGSSSSFGSGSAGPASRCSTTTPSSVTTRPGRSAESRRVCTVTS